MKIIRNILLVALALLLQSILVGRFDIYGIRPDLAMIVLIFLVNESSPVEIIIYGFLIGFLQDVYSPEYLGYNAFSMSLMAYFLNIMKERLTVENYSVKLVSTLIACLMHDGFYLSLYTQFDLSIISALFVRESIPGAVFTSILAIILVRVWEWAQYGGLILVLREVLGFRK